LVFWVNVLISIVFPNVLTEIGYSFVTLILICQTKNCLTGVKGNRKLSKIFENKIIRESINTY